MKEISLYHRLNKKGFFPNKVAEVGVFHPETSLINEYVLNGTPSILVEADPDVANLILNHFKNNKNYTLYECAIFDYEGNIELVRSGASSFVANLDTSPAKINDNIKLNQLNKIKVKSVTFDKIDDGDIDLISIDIEGCEWYVLKYMKSRPTVISIETHGGLYKNPFYNEIKHWMEANDYYIWYKTKSDSVFVKKGKIRIDFNDILNLFFVNIQNFLLKINKKVKRKLFVAKKKQ